MSVGNDPIEDPFILARALGAPSSIVKHGLFLGLSTDRLVAGDD